MYLYDSIFSPCAPVFLRTASATLCGRVVEVCPVSLVDADVLQLLACGADIAVLFGHVGELGDPIEIAFTQRFSLTRM